MRRRGYPAKFRRKLLDLLKDGLSFAQGLAISDQTIYSWRRQDRIDRCLHPGLSTAETADLVKVKKKKIAGDCCTRSTLKAAQVNPAQVLT